MTTTEVGTMKIKKNDVKNPDYLIVSAGQHFEVIRPDFEFTPLTIEEAERLSKESAEIGRPILIYTAGVTMRNADRICDFIKTTGANAGFGRRLRIKDGKTEVVGYKILLDANREVNPMNDVTIVDISEVWDKLTSIQQNNLYHQMQAMAFRNQHPDDSSESSSEEVTEINIDQQN